MSTTPEDTKMQLMAVLPRYTEEYGDNITASAVVESGAIKVTSVDHGLDSGALIVASDVTVTIPAVSVSYDTVSKQATITLTEDHDRTSGIEDNGGYNVATLKDFDDANYNGSFNIITATSNSINISADADAVGALGDFVETRGLYLGFSEITVIDDDTFTIPVQDDLADGIVLNSFKYVTEQRIYIAADVTRAVTKWGQKRDRLPTLFIVYGTENASKDRAITNDAVATLKSQNPVRLKYIPEVTLKTVAATKSEQLAATKVQQIHAEIKPAIRKAMYGTIFDLSDAVSTQFAAIESGNEPEFFNQNDYVHNFDYQIPYELSIEQGDTYRRNVSFRKIIANCKMFSNESDNEIIADADIEV